jgi:hypothetical protein
LFLVLDTTSARTRVSICCTSSPGVPIWRDSAAENGELAPSPSSATWPGAVAKEIARHLLHSRRDRRARIRHQRLPRAA